MLVSLTDRELELLHCCVAKESPEQFPVTPEDIELHALKLRLSTLVNYQKEALNGKSERLA